MKKITLSLIAAGLATASSAYAAVPTGAAPFQVVVPNLQHGVNFTLEGLYLQPSNSDLTYSSSTTSSGSADTANSNSVQPSYALGFGVGLGYVFPQSGNDIQAHWQHFNQSTTNTTNETDSSDEGVSAISASSDTTFKFDTIDLDVGQYLSIGTRLQTRLFAGLRYVNLQNNTTNTYTDPVNAIKSFSEVIDSKFQGAGPRIGVDTSYHVKDCFGVVAHLATALLVGRTTDSTNYYGTDGSSLSLEPDNQTRVVPSLDAKLGFNYTVGFKNGTSNMTIEAGYQVTQYVDAIDKIQENGTTTSSVGFNGPYLSLNFKI